MKLTTKQEGDATSATVLYMSVSLDGFVTGPTEGPDSGLGDGIERLHEWAIPGGRGVEDPALSFQEGGGT